MDHSKCLCKRRTVLQNRLITWKMRRFLPLHSWEDLKIQLIHFILFYFLMLPFPINPSLSYHHKNISSVLFFVVVAGCFSGKSHSELSAIRLILNSSVWLGAKWSPRLYYCFSHPWAGWETNWLQVRAQNHSQTVRARFLCGGWYTGETSDFLFILQYLLFLLHGNKLTWNSLLYKRHQVLQVHPFRFTWKKPSDFLLLAQECLLYIQCETVQPKVSFSWSFSFSLEATSLDCLPMPVLRLYSETQAKDDSSVAGLSLMTLRGIIQWKSLRFRWLMSGESTSKEESQW